MSGSNRTSALVVLLALTCLAVPASAGRWEWGDTPVDPSWVSAESPTQVADSQHFINGEGIRVYLAVLDLPPDVSATEARQPLLEQLIQRVAGSEPELEKKDARAIGKSVGIVYSYRARSDFVAAWVGHTDTQLFQLVTWGPEDRRGDVDAALTYFLGLVEPPSDPHQLVNTLHGADFENERFGFRVDPGDGQWAHFAGDDNVLDLAFAAVRLPGDRGTTPGLLAIRACELEGRDLSAEVALGAFSVASTTLPSESAGWQRSTEGPFEVLRIVDRVAHTIGAVSLGAEVRVGNGMAYLVVATGPAEGDDGLEDVQNVLDSIQYFLPDPHEDNPNAEGQAAFFANVGAIYLDNGQANKALPWLESAHNHAPLEPTIFAYLLGAYSDMGRWSQAVDSIDDAGSSFDSHLEVLQRKAVVLAVSGRTDEAIGAYETLFEMGFRDPDHFEIYTYLLHAERPEAAEEMAAAYAEESPLPQVISIYCDILVQNGRTGKALEVVRAALEDAPNDPTLRTAQAEILYMDDRHEEAYKVIRGVVEEGHDDAYALTVMGAVQLELERYEDARRTFEHALTVAPGDETATELLDVALFMLGQGENASISNVLTPVELPESVRPFPNRSDLSEEDLKAVEDQPYYYLATATAIHFESRTAHRLTLRERVMVNDAQGVEGFSSLRFEFDPAVEDFYVNQVEVRDSTGTLLASDARSESFVLDRSDANMATSDQIVTVPVPGLRPGHTIDFMVTWKAHAPKREFPFMGHWFSGIAPAARSLLYIEADAGAIRWQSQTVSEPAVVESGLLWEVAFPTVYEQEPMETNLEQVFPVVHIGSADASWDLEGRHYLGQIEQLLEIPSETRDVAEALCADLSTDEEKIAALAEYVQQSVTYKAIAFGRRARIMNPSPKVLSDRYGDCKDHSLLLFHLLRAVDVEAELALVSIGGDIVGELPSLDQFDHMIVAVPRPDSAYLFVDATDKAIQQPPPVPYGLAGRETLLLLEEEPALVRIEDYPEGSSTIKSTRTVRVEPGGTLQVEEAVDLYGYIGVGIRAWMQESTDTRADLETWFGNLGSPVDVQSLELENLQSLSEPLRLTISYALEDAFHRVDDLLIGKLPAIWEQWIVSAERVEERRTPFLLANPVDIEFDVVLEAPEGFSLRGSLPEAHGESKFARWKTEMSQAPDAVRFRGEYSRHMGVHAAQAYFDYQDFVQSGRKALGPSVVLERK